MDIFGVSDPVQLHGVTLFDDPNISSDAKARLLDGETVKYESFFDFDKVNELDMFETTRSGAAYLEVVIIPMEHGTDPCARGYLIQIQDITQRKLAEQEKKELQTQRMESISTLAGGIAHDFNNALSGITINLDLLKMDLPNMASINRYLESMHNATQRMVDLTDQLLAYARGGKYRPENMKLDDFVMETLPILSHRLNPAVRMETTFSKGVSYINADHTQMQMVLSAILNNANEATDDAGLIIISAENKAVDEDFAEQHPGFKPGPYVCLSIEDNGKGMNEEEISRIFDPFFTTKFQGRGMGMPAVYGIVKNHDGWISVDSEAGKGTVVRIYFPAVDAESKTPEIRQAEPRIGEGTILVIEDEKMVIDVAQGMLEKLGYRVLTAMTGKDAIHLTKTFDGNIDLALLDIKLPDMQGGRVYPLIMEAHPDLKVIVCSGYDIDGPVRGILDAGAQGFLQKPFSLGILSEKVKEIMKILILTVYCLRRRKDAGRNERYFLRGC